VRETVQATRERIDAQNPTPLLSSRALDAAMARHVRDNDLLPLLAAASAPREKSSRVLRASPGSLMQGEGWEVVGG